MIRKKFLIVCIVFRNSLLFIKSNNSIPFADQMNHKLLALMAYYNGFYTHFQSIWAMNSSDNTKLCWKEMAAAILKIK